MSTTSLHLPIAASRPGRRRAGSPGSCSLGLADVQAQWRQQLLIVALIVVAVGATILGAAVATNTPQPTSVGFGTAQDLATYPGLSPHGASQISSLQHRFGRPMSSRTRHSSIPGSINTYNLRAQNPHGLLRRPMLS